MNPINDASDIPPKQPQARIPGNRVLAQKKLKKDGAWELVYEMD